MLTVIQQYLGLDKNIPIRENIDHEIVIMPLPQDIKRGKASDPRGCALHNAACRVYGDEHCAIGPIYSFIPQRDGNGRLYIARVAADRRTRKAIIKFDKTGVMPVAGFRFTPVPKGHTYDEKRKANRRYTKKLAAGHIPKARKAARQPRRLTRFMPYNRAA